ncbi:MAG: hypothetical protein H7328_11065 [Bdellovibrio sp.]|nr:hypothetical protein [Bdellovibrio sp.]
MSSRNDYIDYVRNVLGVKAIFSNEISEQITPEEIPLLVRVQDFNSYSAEEKDLLTKMLAALKIPNEYSRTFDLAENPNVVCKVAVYLTDELKSMKDLLPNEIHTYSPRVLLHTPALKKAAWDELQKVLRFFQQQPRP